MNKYLSLCLAGASGLLLSGQGFADTNRTTQYFSASVGYVTAAKPRKIIKENIGPIIGWNETLSTTDKGDLIWKRGKSHFSWDIGWGVLTRICSPCMDSARLMAAFDVNYHDLGSHSLRATFEYDKQVVAGKSAKTIDYGQLLRSKVNYHGLDFAAGLVAVFGACKRAMFRAQLGVMAVDVERHFFLDTSKSTIIFDSLAKVAAIDCIDNLVDLLPEVKVGLGWRFACNVWGELNYTHVFGHKYHELREDTIAGRSALYKQEWAHRAPRFDIVEFTLNYKV